MPNELGTKDVLEQVNARLGNVEQDLRFLRGESNAQFAELRSEMNGRFSGIDQRFNWMYGLLVAILMAVAGLWVK